MKTPPRSRSGGGPRRRYQPAVHRQTRTPSSTTQTPLPPLVGDGDGVGVAGADDLEPDGCGAGEDGRGDGPVAGCELTGWGGGVDLADVGTAD